MSSSEHGVRGEGGGRIEFQTDGGRTEFQIDGGRTEFQIDGGRTEFQIDGGRTEFQIDGGRTDGRIEFQIDSGRIEFQMSTAAEKECRKVCSSVRDVFAFTGCPLGGLVFGFRVPSLGRRSA